MKRWISTLLIVSLVVSMAAVLHACGKPKTQETTTQTPGESAAESVADVYENVTESALEEYINSLQGSDLEDLEAAGYTRVEHTTDEHYQEVYDALTLPQAVTTQPVAGTTQAQTTTNPAVRETTKPFEFTYAVQTTRGQSSGTTKANSGEEASSNNAATTDKAAAGTQTAVSDTTVLPELVPDSVSSGSVSVQEVTSVPRPQVTYLDRYVTNILNSKVYTLQMEIKADGASLPSTVYTNGTDRATEMSISQMIAQMLQEDGALPAALSKIGTIRIVCKNANSSNPKVYMVLPTGYIDMSESVSGEDLSLTDLGGGSALDEMLMFDYLEYCGLTSGAGYVCETYKSPQDNTALKVYFTSTPDYSGVTKCESIDLETGEVVMKMEIRLYDKVTNKNAFTVSGKKLDPKDLGIE